MDPGSKAFVFALGGGVVATVLIVGFRRLLSPHRPTPAEPTVTFDSFSGPEGHERGDAGHSGEGGDGD